MIPARQCSSVDLPEPLGRMIATASPARTARSTPPTATVCPNRLVRACPTGPSFMPQSLADGRGGADRLCDRSPSAERLILELARDYSGAHRRRPATCAYRLSDDS